jgi:hypothetical protein
MMVGYADIEKNRLDEIEIGKKAIDGNLRKKEVHLARSNYRRQAEVYVDLGMLRWRQGIDPRADFSSGAEAILAMQSLLQDLPQQSRSRPDLATDLVNVSMFLGGHAMARESVGFQPAQARVLCYRCLVTSVLLQGSPDPDLFEQCNQFLSENAELVDQTQLTYLELLGLRASGKTVDDLVRKAENNWLLRKTSSLFEEGASREGHGAMNELYVDIYLGAILKKIDWEGQSVHRWVWIS